MSRRLRTGVGLSEIKRAAEEQCLQPSFKGVGLEDFDRLILVTSVHIINISLRVKVRYMSALNFSVFGTGTGRLAIYHCR